MRAFFQSSVVQSFLTFAAACYLPSDGQHGVPLRERLGAEPHQLFGSERGAAVGTAVRAARDVPGTRAHEGKGRNDQLLGGHGPVGDARRH